MVEPASHIDPDSFKKQVGKFFISDKVLGVGASAKVMIGCHADNRNKLVAVKVIEKKNITDKDPKKFIELLQREIQILQSLNHPNIVKMLDVAQTSNNIYIYLEFCNGGSLKDYLKKKGGFLSEKEAIIFFKELCEAFKSMELQHIVHRDMKPENVLINNDQVKISDFGFSRIIEEGDPNYYSRLGTPLYMPPQILRGEKYSAKCDVWSVGILLFYMLYGFHPFIPKGEESKIGSLQQLLKNIDMKDIYFPEKPIRSQKVKTLLKNMLGKKEEDRCSWAEIFESEIVKSNPEDVKKNGELLEKEGNDEFSKSMYMNKLYVDNKRVIDQIEANKTNRTNVESIAECPSFEEKSNVGGSKNEITLTSQEAGENLNTKNVGDNIEEQKLSKYSKRFNDYLLFERNLSMFFNNLVNKLYIAFFNKNIEIAVDRFWRLLYLTSKFSLLSIQRVQDVLDSKIKITNKNPVVWDFYITTQYFKKTRRLVENDLNKLNQTYKEIDKKTKIELIHISEIENDITILKTLSVFLEKLSHNKFTTIENVIADIKIIIKDFLHSIKEKISKFPKENLILVKYLIIASDPYKFFKWSTKDHISEPDFDIFYEEVENSEDSDLLQDIKRNWI